ncbi:cytochrome P450 3A27-like isoform X1 [Haemorhous mexicanus]|uniref:cytochrome P450 3A27-like isoform X1 n=1 Tax=Haemorhous mexicanus TaxID=30427 RepID=UPI0028BE99A5|nr:cytochrome P450 3A27-like isoform X1 [Haemorhous mexicanus]
MRLGSAGDAGTDCGTARPAAPPAHRALPGWLPGLAGHRLRQKLHRHSYGIWPYQTFKKLGIPGPRPLPFVGTFLEYWHGVHNFDQKCFEKYGKIWGFSKENKEGIDPYTFLQFGASPRNCIGMRFAHLVVKVAVVVLLQNFSFRPCKDTPSPLVLDSKGFMQPKKPIVLKMVPRAQADLKK